MEQLDGISRAGEAQIFQGPQYGAPADNILARQEEERKKRAQAAAGVFKSPEIEGLFPDDYRDINNQYGQVEKLTSEYFRRGYNLSQPTNDKEFELQGQVLDMIKKIEAREEAARYTKAQHDDLRKAGLSGKYDIGGWQTVNTGYLGQRAENDGDIDARQLIPLPSLGIKTDPFDEGKTIKDLLASFKAQEDVTSSREGTLRRVDTTTAYPEESRISFASSLITAPGGEKFYAAKYNALPPAEQQKIQTKAKESGMDPLTQYVKDNVVDPRIAQTQTKRTESEISTAWAKFGVEQNKYEELSDLLLRQTAMIASGEGMDQGPGPQAPGFFSGKSFYGGNIVKIQNSADGNDKIDIVVGKTEKSPFGQSATTYHTVTISKSQMWTGFIMPMVEESFGPGKSAEVLDAMAKRAKKQYGSDLNNFDWNKVLQGKSKPSEPTKSGVKWQSGTNTPAPAKGVSGTKWK